MIYCEFGEELDKHETDGCSICGNPIMAETEDWENPVCTDHWEEMGSPAEEPKKPNEEYKH